jgi:PAS domain S-box-containing protein
MNEIILVAEDSIIQAMLLENTLQNNNYKVAVAADGKKAMNWLQENKPAMVITDIMMPEMDGYELCRQIKSNDDLKDIPVILLTSLTGPEEVIEGLIAGADSFVTKPYDNTFLIAHIEKILADKTGHISEKKSFGVEIVFEGKKRFIQSDQQHIIKILLNIYEGSIQQNSRLIQTQEQLKALNENLESLVEERTAALLFEIEISKQNEASLRVSESKYSGLFHNAQIGMFQSKIDGSAIIAANKKLGELFGCSEEELIGNPGIMRWADVEERNKMIAALKIRGSLENFEMRFLTTSNEVRTAMISVILYPDEGYLEGSVVDITERKRADDEIRSLNATLESRVAVRTKELESINKELDFHIKEIEQFTYIATHDLKEPLRTMTTFTELIKQEYAGVLDKDGHRYIDFVYNSALRMEQLVTGLMEYALLGKAGHKSIVDCNIIVHDVLDDMYDLFQRSNANIILQGELPVLYGYPTELRLLFQNLIDNAIKFQKKGARPEIKISSEFNHHEWLFRIQDNGIGIPENASDKIFVIFKRLHNRSDYTGTGIGLAHCKKIIQLHEGRIWVDSTPGEGSIFSFTIKSEKP